MTSGSWLTAAVASRDVTHPEQPAGCVKESHPTPNDPAVTRHLNRYRRQLAGSPARIAEEHTRFLAFVVQNHIEHAVLVDVHQTDALSVEEALVQADFFGHILKSTVAQIAEQTVRPS